MKRTSLFSAALIAFALTLSLGCVAALAQNNWVTPGGSNADGKVEMCLNAAGQAVPLTSGQCAGTVPVGGSFSANVYVATPNFTNGTITVTNTFQQALASNTLRRSCDIQNQGTHNMFLLFTATSSAPGSTAPAKIMAAGTTMVCNDYIGDVLQGYVWITGTAADPFQVTEYH